MRFSSDEQRRACFARIHGMSANQTKFARIPKKMISDLMSGGEESSDLFDDRRSDKLDLPDGTQAVFLTSDYGSSQKTKQAAAEAANIVESGEIKADAVPLWSGDKLIGHALIAWEHHSGMRRKYMDTPSVARDLRYQDDVPDESVSEERSKGLPVVEFKEDADTVVDDTDIKRQEYYNRLLSEFEQSKEEGFLRFKKKFDDTYAGKKFSKRAKKDFDAVYENMDGGYVCSYCSDVFNDRMAAASHASSCSKNSFNGPEFSEDDDEESSGVWGSLI